MDTLKLSTAQMKALEEAGGYEPPKEPEKPLSREALNVLHRMVRERYFGEARKATTKERLLMWSSFTAMRWYMWSWRNYVAPRF